MDKGLVFIVAATVGFVGGILLAPKSGKDMREDIMRKKDEIQDKAEKSINAAKRGASSIKGELKATGEDVKRIANQPTA